MSSFSEIFSDKYKHNTTPLCVGLDPHIDLLSELFSHNDKEGYSGDLIIQSIYDFCESIINICCHTVNVVKPQAAFFEQFGWKGVKCLEEISNFAKSKDLLVILDAKRGDIGSTAKAYAKAYIGNNTPFDAITVNPYLGVDSILPFSEMIGLSKKGIFILVKTSNLGSEDFQNLVCDNGSLYSIVAKKTNDISDIERQNNVWSNIGAVVGATYPEEARRLRKIMPNSLFLVPGYGAQGASAKEAVSGFIDLGNGYLEGGIVSSSRNITFPIKNLKDFSAWENAVVNNLKKSNNDLMRAVKIY